jgi:hypothetical protein
MIDRRLYFDETPTEAPWGELKNVPLNVTEETIVTEDGKEETHYRADVIHKVETPVTVESIVKAAIEETYSKDERSQVLLKIGNDEDMLVKKYKAFVSEITNSALASGYKYSE